MNQILELLRPIQSGIEYIIIFLYNHIIANYGIVIILLTIIVRIVLVPLTISQTRSMAKMQKIQPEIKELQKKYKDDKQKLQQETMEFYKKNNVNPLAGCLPLLFQMPVFFALFQALRNPSGIVTNVLGSFNLEGVANSMNIGLAGIRSAAEFSLTGAVNPNYNFLWMNLNKMDPYFILVILMVATMFLSMKMTTTDANQSKIMFVMPLVFGFISWQFPSGILIYWVTTNAWSIGQQWLVNRLVKKEKVKEELKKEKASLAGSVEISEEEKKSIRRKLKKKRKKKR
ncbi:MAG: YidC/Oxa1 family membrane protein insertase [Actinomycetota bacterium]|nr:YidC/Oxa1 family membrane protein insertase [Actinomycetota bacterium]